jgi:hypothetical protein
MVRPIASRASLPNRFCAFALVVAAVSGAVPAAQQRPLPDLDPFLAQARTRLQTDNERQRAYVYVETQRTRKLDGAGKPQNESVKVVESYPPLPGESERWERVLEENGKKKTAAELAKQDEDRRRTAERVAKRLSSQNPSDQAKVTQSVDSQRREALQRINDIFIVYDIKMVGRESLDGHDTIQLALEPRPNARPATREGKWMQAFRCRVWVSETDYEVVKLEVDALRDLNIGFGMLARMNTGTHMSFVRRMVNGEVWLPERADYTIRARVLMLKRYDQGGTIEFSNYRKFGVDTSTTIAPPAQ